VGTIIKVFGKHDVCLSQKKNLLSKATSSSSYFKCVLKYSYFVLGELVRTMLQQSALIVPKMRVSLLAVLARRNLIASEKGLGF
jgi:hypothetical protein